MPYKDPEKQKAAQVAAFKRNQAKIQVRNKEWKRRNADKINAARHDMTVEEYREWKAGAEECAAKSAEERERAKVERRAEQVAEKPRTTRSKTEGRREPQPSVMLALGIEESVRRRLEASRGE